MKTNQTEQGQATARPWIVDDRHIHCESGFVYKDDRMMMDGDDIVCEVNTDCREGGLLTETDKANLRLIVRAVNLIEGYEAVEKAMQAIADCGERGELAIATFGDIKSLAKSALAALAKMKGEK